jgi:hypothetical protein
MWRARLGIAVLSERTRPNSAYRAYIRNLPFEFAGMPVFFSRTEFNFLQDVSLIEKTEDRCTFLREFADQVLRPLTKSKYDPFSGHRVDVNVFGWCFAIASSRALRGPRILKENSGKVLVPGVDMISHSFSPNCEVVPARDGFFVVTKTAIQEGEEITIDYGPLSNKELLCDFGFTMDDNPNESIDIELDHVAINAGRCAMGQMPLIDGAVSPIPLIQRREQERYEDSLDEASEYPIGSTSSTAPIGRGNAGFFPEWMQQWQLQWLAVLRLHGSNIMTHTSIKGTSLDGIDGRIWAALRVIYADSEDDLLRHGYNPFILQTAGSITSAAIESRVLKTMIGLLAIILNSLESDMKSDVESLAKEDIVAELEANYKSKKAGDAIGLSRGNVVRDVQDTLLKLFEEYAPEHLPQEYVAQKQQQEVESIPGEGVRNVQAKVVSGYDIPGSEKLRGGIENENADGFVLKSNKEPLSVEDMVKQSYLAGEGQEGDYSVDAGDLEATAAAAALSTTRTSTSTDIGYRDEDADSLVNPNPSIVSALDSDSDWEVEESLDHISTSALEDSGDLNELERDISAMGGGLRINIREALKYRIRKKRMLIKLILNLAEKYKAVADDKDPLLMSTADPRIQRQTKIKSLLDEIRYGAGGSGKSADDGVLSNAARLSKKWAKGESSQL